METGLTDRLDLGFYNVARQKAFDDFEYRGVKLRSRYRFGDEGDFLVDPAVYLEAAYFGDEIELEQRTILAKRFGSLETSLNLKFEQEFKLEGDKTEFEWLFLPSFGLGYHLNEHVALAAEYLGRMKVEHGELEYFVHYLGPVISVASQRFWWTVGVHPELNRRVLQRWAVRRRILLRGERELPGGDLHPRLRQPRRLPHWHPLHQQSEWDVPARVYPDQRLPPGLPL